MANKLDKWNEKYILLYPLMSIVVLILYSCGTSKNTQLDTRVDYSEKIKAVSTQHYSLLAEIKQSNKEFIERLSNIKIENKLTYLSIPDSMGQQFPTMVSETKINEESKESKITHITTKTTIDRLFNKIDSLEMSISNITQLKGSVIHVSWLDKYISEITIIFLIIIIVIQIFHN